MTRLLVVLILAASCTAPPAVRYPGPPECARLVELGVIVMGECP